MQHTEKYRFDLIEKDDVFSPDALNENMEKVEGALETKADVADMQALDLRLQVFEARHFASGITTGRTTHLGFTPKVLLIAMGSSGTFFAVPGASSSYSNIIEGGFQQSLADHANYAAWG